MDFDTRYKKLNNRQREAVDHIDGPLMVIAGPGTGKTELLSMRVASILRKTDTLPGSILCLTYTDSGVAAMRRRLAGIIGPAAYKVAVHTFHSFSTEIINHNRKFFYNGASFRPADELNRYEITRAIFEELDHANPLSGQMNGSFTYLKDSLTTISELKASGLTSAELLAILEANQEVIDASESILAPIFAPGIKKTTLQLLLPVPKLLRAYSSALPTPGITPLADVMADSLEVALQQAETNSSTKPITAWRSAWLKKSEKGEFILKSRERQAKLRAVSFIYDQFTSRMQTAGLFDFDDMILNTIHAMEVMPELRFNLQEQYLYIMVDEFQDTNLAQMRILLNLINNEVNEGEPNLMVVGDDDQAIYGFQGATVGNIHNFIEQFPDAPRIILTDNYRSTPDILARSRSVIQLGQDRLEDRLGFEKVLAAKNLEVHGEPTRLIELLSLPDERSFIANSIADRIKAGEEPNSIAVLARRHNELIDLLPYLYKAGIPVNYERRDNVLELDSIKLIEYIATLLITLLDGQQAKACGMLPELLAHPAFAIESAVLWQLGVKAQNERKSWLEIMPDMPELAPIHAWLLTEAQAAAHTPLERMCDRIIGTPAIAEEQGEYASPLFAFYFSPEKLEADPLLYLSHLNGLITLRARLREYYPDSTPTLRTFLGFTALQRESGGTITSVQPLSQQNTSAISLMTAHKSKGLEFDSVYVIGATDSAWGERARSRSRLISYPENLPLMPAGELPDDRLRLFYVAMTRARRNLIISFSASGDNGKDQLMASFLSNEGWKAETIVPATTLETMTKTAELSWYQPIISPIEPTMREILAPRLENYKLNATHLSNFLDLTRGGPEAFVINDLLKFPQAPAPHAAYGSAIHAALQSAHAHTTATGELKPHEDILKDFETALSEQYLPSTEFEHFLQRGSLSLGAFLAANQDKFLPNQKTELNFGGQGVVIGDTPLTGIIDVIDINNKAIIITDYKTGKPVSNWKGSTEYEKIKLHRYKNQLLFYDLLARESRDYAKYDVEKCIIQFVEPTRSGDIVCLEATFTNEDRERMKRLISAVCKHITTLEMPDTSGFEPTFKGMLAFEDFLVDEA